jgi:hypothetical protein
MKKILIVLAVVLLASPALARLDITMSQGATWNEVVVSYNKATEPNLIRAFALNVQASNNALITAAPLSSFNGKYWVYPGSIDINATTNDVNSYGSPIAKQSDYSADTLGGLNTTGMTVEMGSLYTATDGNQPAASGQLFKFTVDRGCTITISQNVIRGGVVLENPDAAADVNAPTYTVVLGVAECAALTQTGRTSQLADYNTYRNNGWITEAASWCASFHCVGDADGATTGFPNNWRIYNNDLAFVINNWSKRMGAKGPGPTQTYADPRADVDHKSTGFPNNFRVYNGDLNRVVYNWQKKDNCWTTQPPCPMTDAANNAYTIPYGCY